MSGIICTEYYNRIEYMTSIIIILVYIISYSNININNMSWSKCQVS